MGQPGRDRPRQAKSGETRQTKPDGKLPAANSSWVVVDSRGVTVGVLASQDRVIRQLGDQWVTLPISSVGFVGASYAPLYYEGPVCAGEPYIYGAASLPIPAALIGATGIGFIPRPGLPQAVTVGSWRAMTEQGALPCQELGAPITHVFGVASELDLSEFKPPFHIEGPDRRD